jgi:diadenosine tetraphosphate (Ap4A) HIT family hydrolase
MSIIYENSEIKIESEPSQIPWLKLFTQEPYKEMSSVPKTLRVTLYELLHLIEEEMLTYFQPDKMNIASFGNYVPHVHWHIMARFKNDNYFPEPMWGQKQRESHLELPSFENFYKQLETKISENYLY